MSMNPNVSTTPKTPSDLTGPVVTIVDVQVKAIKSTPQTQYYVLEKYWKVRTDEAMPIRKNITLLWCSQEPGFFICQLEDGSKIKVHRYDLLMETAESKERKNI